MTDTATPRTLVEFAENCFKESDLYYGHGTDNPADEAFYLVMTALQLDFDCDEAVLDQALPAAIADKVKTLVRRRIDERVPVAYLVNEAWFAGLPFYVDKRVLIPRSPVAELIQEKFSPWIEEDDVTSILDLGTGSACIPVACAYAFAEAEIDAVDIDTDALAVAVKNLELHNMTDRIRLYQSDLFEQLPARQYDIIISNPPYVGQEEMQDLPAEYRHEPVHALEADDNGLLLVDRILKQACNYLTEQGILIVEVGNSKEALVEKYPGLPFTWLEFENGGDGVFLLNKSDLLI